MEQFHLYHVVKPGFMIVTVPYVREHTQQPLCYTPLCYKLFSPRGCDVTTRTFSAWQASVLHMLCHLPSITFGDRGGTGIEM